MRWNGKITWQNDDTITEYCPVCGSLFEDVLQFKKVFFCNKGHRWGNIINKVKVTREQK